MLQVNEFYFIPNTFFIIRLKILSNANFTYKAETEWKNEFLDIEPMGTIRVSS